MQNFRTMDVYKLLKEIPSQGTKLYVMAYHEVKNVNKFLQHLKLYKERNVILTFDDGDVSFYKNVFPIVREFKIPTILFIITSLIDTSKPFWWDEVKYHLGEIEGEKKVWDLKKISNKSREAFIKKLKESSKRSKLEVCQLTSEQLREMQSSGIVIGNHTHTHPLLDMCIPSEIKNELLESKEFFEKNNLSGFDLFAYPNGNHNNKVESIIRDEGIKYAFLFDHRINKGEKNPLKISRLRVNDSTSIWKLYLIMSGIHSNILPIRKKIHSILNV